MNKIFKKLTTLGIMTVMMSSFIGCGKSTDTTSGGNNVKENGKVVVEYWYGLGGKLGENMENIIKDFNNSQDNYIVKGVAQEDYDSTFKNLQAAIAGKKAPALTLLESDKVEVLSNKDLLADLSKYTGEDSDYNQDNYVESFMNIVKKGDKLVGFPAYGTTQLLYYDKKSFEDAGINLEEIKTWMDLADAAAKLTKKEGDEVKFYGWEPMWDENNLIDASLSNGASFLSEDGKTVTINSDEWVEVWESFRKWIHDDKIMRIHSGGQGWEYWYATIDDVVQGKAAGYTGSSGDQGDLDFTKLGAMEQPAFKDGKEAKPVAEGRFFAVPANINEDQIKGAYEFIKYFASPEISAKWSIASGYISVNKLSADTDVFKEHVSKNPQAAFPTSQATHASAVFTDPTNGKIYDALKIAADKVEIENVSAKEALDEAQKTAQKALDSVNK